MAFWIARAAGSFAGEDIELDIVTPEHPRLAAQQFTNGAQRERTGGARAALQPSAADPQVTLAAAQRTLAFFPSIHRAPPPEGALAGAIENRFAHAAAEALA